MNSATVFAGTEGCTTSMSGAEATSVTGARSLVASYGSLYRLGLTLKVSGTISATWPSGALFATISVATMPEAPGRFSTTTGWPKLSESFCAMSRPMMSVEPPGEKPSIRRTVFVGYACANALPASAIAAQIEINPQRLLLRMSPPQFTSRLLRGESIPLDSLRSQFVILDAHDYETPHLRELPRRLLRALLRHPRARSHRARRARRRMAALGHAGRHH